MLSQSDISVAEKHEKISAHEQRVDASRKDLDA
jgi:hypothetical protein